MKYRRILVDFGVTSLIAQTLGVARKTVESALMGKVTIKFEEIRKLATEQYGGITL
ncbi:MAG: hypothetical protein KBS70_06945 [Bacteroidales bacterium]|nr:hypothetical protein [Candidatus Colicola equi]